MIKLYGSQTSELQAAASRNAGSSVPARSRAIVESGAQGAMAWRTAAGHEKARQEAPFNCTH